MAQNRKGRTVGNQKVTAVISLDSQVVAVGFAINGRSPALTTMRRGEQAIERHRIVRALDPRRLLSSAFFYRTMKLALAPRSSREAFVHDYVHPEPEDRVLDIGCGPADDLEYMPDTVRYVGFDLSERYIEAARRRWGERGTFFQARVSSSLLQDEEFDIVLAIGVIHHLDDGQVFDLLELAHSVLRPGGRLVSRDPVITTPQRPVARFLVERDRGEYVRDTASYLRLAHQVFTDATITTRGDMLRCPYDHAIMVMHRRPPIST